MGLMPELHLGAEGDVRLRRNLPHAQAMVCDTPLLSLLLHTRVLQAPSGVNARRSGITASQAI